MQLHESGGSTLGNADEFLAGIWTARANGGSELADAIVSNMRLVGTERGTIDRQSDLTAEDTLALIEALEKAVRGEIEVSRAADIDVARTMLTDIEVIPVAESTSTKAAN